jgi:hypothetical protein
MANWYTSREDIKRAITIVGVDNNPRIDRTIEAVSLRIEHWTRRFFIPKTETRLYRWPNPNGRGWILWLDQGLISLTTLQTKAQDSSPTTIAAADYFLEPANLGPPFDRIEIDLSSTSAFASGNTPQQSISVLGSWGYKADAKSVGTVASGLSSSSSAVSMVCSDSSLLTGVSVGETLLIESEQIFVSQKVNAALASIKIDGALTKDQSEVSVTVDTGHGINDGEVILVDSERMYVESSTATVLTVKRAYDGSVLAVHSDNADVQTYRTLTIERGVNGTTAATHANATAVSKYEPPFAISQLCIAEVVADLSQEGAAWGRVVGAGDGAGELSGRELANLRKTVVDEYVRMRVGVV